MGPPSVGSPAKARGQPHGKAGKAGKGEGLDGRWMLKLVYPNATTLGPYLEAWLRDIALASPASSSAAAISRFGGPADYLTRKNDQPEFKQVSGSVVLVGGWVGGWVGGAIAALSMARARGWLEPARATCCTLHTRQTQFSIRYQEPGT